MKTSVASAEIHRIGELGFVDWSKDQNGVRTKVLASESQVSFPGKIYEKQELSRNDFWSKHRSRMILGLIRRKETEIIWELGAGDGRVSQALRENGVNVIAIEPHYSGCLKLAKNGIENFCGELSDLALPKESLKAVAFFDVLEHVESEQVFLEEIHQVLSNQGMIFLTVPAHRWLFSEHDIALGHFRRYTKKTLEKVLSDCGFYEIECRYIFHSLVIPSFIIRRIPYLLKRIRNHSKLNSPNTDDSNFSESVLKLPNWLDYLLGFVVKNEEKLKLPFGLSLLAVAKKVGGG